jgi:hypothetical protein
MDKACSMHGEKTNAYKVSVGKPQGRRPPGRPRRRREDNIKIDFREIVLGVIDWIDLAQDRDRYRALVKRVINFRFA